MDQKKHDIHTFQPRFSRTHSIVNDRGLDTAVCDRVHAVLS